MVATALNVVSVACQISQLGGIVCLNHGDGGIQMVKDVVGHLVQGLLQQAFGQLTCFSHLQQLPCVDRLGGKLVAYGHGQMLVELGVKPHIDQIVPGGGHQPCF
ncbi:hypothetical protein D3C85_675100 [compost metagenome]